jgi:transposase
VVRGSDERSGSLFSYVDLERRVPKNHPLRPIREIANEALSALEADFAALYAPLGRPSIPPEKLRRSLLLQAFYTVRSERQLMERLEFDLVFRWVVLGLTIRRGSFGVLEERDRLLEGEIAGNSRRHPGAAEGQAAVVLDTSVDGTLVEAWASMKSFNLGMAGATAGRRRMPRPTLG